MDILIPFEKEIDFKNNISEITKMSLEEDYSLNGMDVLGNFYISGEYKINDISVNVEDFSYTLPFSVSLTDKIKRDTLDFNIEDFNYEINGSKLKVLINYSVKGEIEESFREIDEDDLENELSFLDTEIEENNVIVNEPEDTREVLNPNEVINNIGTNDKEDSYVTYHVHIVKMEETEESICSLYKISNSLLKEYNNYDVLNTGDKLIIPNE